MKRFVVAIDGLTAVQTKKISDIFRGKQGWWHWIDGFWLVTDKTNTLTAAEIRDAIGEVVPSARRIVIEITGHEAWAGYGPTKESKNMFKWIRETWVP